MGSRRKGLSDQFFSAHGLGEAYTAAGQYAGKRAKINAALRAAEQRGDVDEVLDQADVRFGTARQVSTTGNESEMNPQISSIFVSRSSANAEIVASMVKALKIGGVPPGRIFYSSRRSTGIPAGETGETGTFTISARPTVRDYTSIQVLIAEAH